MFRVKQLQLPIYLPLDCFIVPLTDFACERIGNPVSSIISSCTNILTKDTRSVTVPVNHGAGLCCYFRLRICDYGLLLKGVTLEGAEVWFHEHMECLGWLEDGGVYCRSDDGLTEIIRFGFQTESSGIAVNVEEHRQIPPAWWPTPTSTPNST